MRQFLIIFWLLQFCFLNMKGQKYVVVGIDELEGNVNTAIPKDSVICDVKGVRFVMMGVQGGTFTMGNTAEQKRRSSDEIPTHQVSINTFYISQTEVTQSLWEIVMGGNPSVWKNPKAPVENISWWDAEDFINKLNLITKKHFRFLTEAEWEFAARGGVKSNVTQYSGSWKVADVAWYGENSDWHPHEVKCKKPNELGIYDMSGNVDEWCSDWKCDYGSKSLVNPKGCKQGERKIIRGGGFYGYSADCRTAHRDCLEPGSKRGFVGLRLAMEYND